MKLHMYEGGYRVPGIVYWPGKAKPGTVCDEAVCAVDVLPTLCEAAGVTVPADRPIDGASILPILEGKPVERKTPLYWQYDKAIGGPMKVTMRQGPWKLLADADLKKFELYNLQDDIGEKKDLADAQPERVKQMAEEMRRLHRDINRTADGK